MITSQSRAELKIRQENRQIFAENLRRKNGFCSSYRTATDKPESRREKYSGILHLWEFYFLGSTTFIVNFTMGQFNNVRVEMLNVKY